MSHSQPVKTCNCAALHETAHRPSTQAHQASQAVLAVLGLVLIGQVLQLS